MFPTTTRLSSPVLAEQKVADATAAPCALPTLCRLAGDVLSPWLGTCSCGTVCTLGGDSRALQDVGQPGHLRPSLASSLGTAAGHVAWQGCQAAAEGWQGDDGAGNASVP